VTLMVLHSFAMGTSTVFFETAASALFLTRFSAGALPWVYIAAAVVNTLTGIVYARLQRGTSFRALMLGTVAFLLAGVVGLRAGLALVDAAALVFGLLVFYRVLSALTDLEYWAVATRLYDVRQAKRLFGLVGSGEVVARIAGSFSVPFLVRPIGVANLVLLSAAGLGACLALLVALVPADAGATPPPRSADRVSRLSGLLRQPYLVVMLSTVGAGVLGKYFVDYAFLAELKGHADDARRLASFFGVFSGVTQAASLLTRLFVSGPLLARFGIRLGLLVLPAVHVAVTLGIVASGVAGAGPAAFWLVILNQGAYKTLKHPIDNPSLKVLYQPLRREDRLGAQIAVETLVTPFVVGVAGIVLLAFDAFARSGPVGFAWVMLPVFVAWWVLARRGGHAYASALVDALKSRLADAESLPLDDPRTVSAIREVLRDGSSGDVVFALELLDRAPGERGADLVLDLVDHPSPEVRRAAARRLEGRPTAAAVEALSRLATRDGDPAVRSAALESLAPFDGCLGTVESALSDPDETVRRGAVVSLLRREGPRHAEASRLLLDAATASEEARRAWAALVIGESGRADLAGALEGLLADPDTDVRRAAITAAPRLAASTLWPRLSEGLSEPSLSGLAARALIKAGEGVIQALASFWDRDGRPGVRARVARVIGRVGGAEAVGFLRSRLDTPDETIRHEVLVALARCGFHAGESDRAAILGLVGREVEDAAWSLSGVRDLAAEPELALVASALAGEAARNRERILLLLSFLGDPRPFLRAREHLTSVSKEKRAYALEVLDLAMPPELRGMVLPLFDDSPEAKRAGRFPEGLGGETLSPVERLRAILKRSDEWTTPWTRAAALHDAGRLGLGLRSEAAEAAASGSAAIVRETARAMLEGLAGHGQEEGKPMLTVERVITLKAVDMFSRASEDVLTDVAGILEEVQVPAGEVVFEKGAIADSMYIIVSGRVRVYDGERTIGDLGPRDIFGDLALLDPEPRLASISTLTDTRLLRLDREAFAELMAGNIEIVRGILHVLCERLRRALAPTA
jgi:HEAT repeat protein